MQLIHAGDLQRTGKHQVRNLPDFARITVFDGKHAGFTVSLLHLFICLMKGMAGKQFRVRKFFSVAILAKNPSISL